MISPNAVHYYSLLPETGGCAAGGARLPVRESVALHAVARNLSRSQYRASPQRAAGDNGHRLWLFQRVWRRNSPRPRVSGPRWVFGVSWGRRLVLVTNLLIRGAYRVLWRAGSYLVFSITTSSDRRVPVSI